MKHAYAITRPGNRNQPLFLTEHDNWSRWGRDLSAATWFDTFGDACDVAAEWNAAWRKKDRATRCSVAKFPIPTLEASNG